MVNSILTNTCKQYNVPVWIAAMNDKDEDYYRALFGHSISYPCIFIMEKTPQGLIVRELFDTNVLGAEVSESINEQINREQIQREREAQRRRELEAQRLLQEEQNSKYEESRRADEAKLKQKQEETESEEVNRALISSARETALQNLRAIPEADGDVATIRITLVDGRTRVTRKFNLDNLFEVCLI